MKIRAYQVAPEYQEAPALEDMFDDSIIIAGNDRLNGWETEYYKTVYNALFEGVNPCEEGEENFDAWERLINDSTEQAISDDKAICKGLELLTGEKWAYTELRGTAQREWNGCYYMADIWTRVQLNAVEMEYFNMGAEWRIKDEDGEEWGNTYTHSWDDEENRAEIASVIGVEPEDVTLYLFEGWTRTANYKEA